MKRATNVSCFLILVCVSVLMAKDPDVFNISTDALQNNRISLAANGNGDVLAVWSSIDFKNSFKTRVLMRFYNNKKGSFKAGPVRVLSASDKEGYAPHVVFHPDLNVFLVIWDTRDVRKIIDADLHYCFVSFKGKAGTPGVLVDTPLNDTHSALMVVPADLGNSAGPSADSPAFIVAWMRKSLAYSGRQQAGLWTQQLAADGSLIGTMRKIVQAEAEQDPQGSNEDFVIHDIIPGNAVLNPKTDEFVLSYQQFQPPYSADSVSSYLASIRSDGSVGKKVMVAGKNSYELNIVLLSKKRMLAAWNLYDKKGIANRLIKLNLKAKKNMFSPMDGNDQLFFSRLVKLGSDDGSYQVFADDTSVYGVYISSKGKLDEDTLVHLYDHNGTLTGMNIASPEGTDVIFVGMDLIIDSVRTTKGFVFNPMTDDLTPASK